MEEGHKRKIMVAVDGGECSQYALEWALNNLHDSISNSKLVVFTAQPISDLDTLYVSSVSVIPTDLVRSFHDIQKKKALDLLQVAKNICSRYGVAPETFTTLGEPQEAICEAVEKLNVQLLVLGSHGRSTLQRAFLGSVSNYCVHHAKCPVLVVKKKHEDRHHSA